MSYKFIVVLGHLPPRQRGYCVRKRLSAPIVGSTTIQRVLPSFFSPSDDLTQDHDPASTPSIDHPQPVYPLHGAPISNLRGISHSFTAFIFAMSSLARPMLRSPALRVAARRFESTATQKATENAKQAASKATENAKQAASRAQEGLSRVTSAAGPAIAGYAKGVANTLGKVGGRTGKVVGFVERTWIIAFRPNRQPFSTNNRK